MYIKRRMFIMYTDEKKPQGVHTTISYDKWFLAKTKGIAWSRALEIGIELMAGRTSTRDEINEQINVSKRTVDFWENKLKEFEENEKRKTEIYKMVMKHEDEIKKSIKLIKERGISILSGRLARWNNKTGVILNQDEYHKILTDYQNGVIPKEAKA